MWKNEKNETAKKNTGQEKKSCLKLERNWEMEETEE